ncbi:Protein RETICULATA-RELATED 3 like [Actinidia chinensis var. chinensis]|uniref:Protein RETICULATA-RELATED 3 like n=1 Tax=Actinidia chinensis var. chinensis TaxID=1590841 RepID=A0A2R6QZB1_ACTCC|nr:Protein RETICULATA-RELATED 3 like [Actinidia chinensis var. chinensis]
MATTTVTRLQRHFMSLSKSSHYMNRILSHHPHHHHHLPHSSFPLQAFPHSLPFFPNFLQRSHFSCSTTGNGSSNGGSSGGKNPDNSSALSWVGPLGAFVSGWRSRVAADPQFPFKVVMEELVGVSACVIGDMASRPNFGLNELDFVFSTLVVGCILNFVLMYLLAPTNTTASSNRPNIFSNCPKSHMFESGPYTLVHRFGTFVYKGALFAAVGFAAGLVGTAISNGLIKMRKTVDTSFETPNKAPPTILNAATWAIHMGVSSNLRYQTLNGIEFFLGNLVPSVVFKSSVVILRCLNNVIGGMSFVILARLTGSQSVEKEDKEDKVVNEDAGLASAQNKLLVGSHNSTVNQSA